MWVFEFFVPRDGCAAVCLSSDVAEEFREKNGVYHVVFCSRIRWFKITLFRLKSTKVQYTIFGLGPSE